RHVSKRGIRLHAFRERFLAACGESSAMKMNRGHLLRRDSCGRPIDVQLQIHVATLAEDDIAFDFDACLSGAWSLRSHNFSERGYCRACQSGSNETSSVHH